MKIINFLSNFLSNKKFITICILILIVLNCVGISQNVNQILSIKNQHKSTEMTQSFKFNINHLKTIAQNHAILLNTKEKCLQTQAISAIVLFRFLEQIQPLLYRSIEIEKLEKIENNNERLNRLKICGY